MQTSSSEVFRKYTTDETFNKIVMFDSIGEMWDSVCTQYADNIAIIDKGISYSYLQLNNDVEEFRPLIRNDGKPKKIGILLKNSYDFAKVFLSVATSGNLAVILPPQLDEDTIFNCCKGYALDTLVYSDETECKIIKAKEQNPATNYINEKEHSAEKCSIVNVSKESPCVIMFTGGTTGKSKGVLLSNEAVMQGVINGCYGYNDVFCQKYLLILPLSHVFGLIRNFLTSLYTGGTLYICNNQKDMFADIAKFNPNILVLVPALADMALSLSKQFKRNMLGKELKYIICGASAVSPYLVEEYEKLGVKLFPGYGLTESANLVSGNPESLRKPDSVGIMYPNQEYRIENGELWLKGKNMMMGYVGVPNDDSMQDGWFKTGDLVRIDDEGFLYITGRCKEVIVLENGENISPAEAESYFDKLSFVKASQVFEAIADNGKHILALEVLPRFSEIDEKYKGNEEEYIISELEKVNMTMPPYMRVNKITIRKEDFQRTPSMKIVRYKL